MKKSWRIKNTQEHYTGVQCLKQMLCIHQIKIIRYQQTWHTIEFSNNKHSRHHKHQKTSDCFAPEQLFKLTTKSTKVNSTFPARSPHCFFQAFSARPDQRREIKLYTGSHQTQNRPVHSVIASKTP